MLTFAHVATEGSLFTLAFDICQLFQLVGELTLKVSSLPFRLGFFLFLLVVFMSDLFEVVLPLPLRSEAHLVIHLNETSEACNDQSTFLMVH